MQHCARVITFCTTCESAISLISIVTVSVFPQRIVTVSVFPQRIYVLQADKPFTHSIQSLWETPLTLSPPNYWKSQVTTRPSVRLSPAIFYNTPNSPYSAQNQWSTWNQAILLRSLPGYLPSFQQSLAHWVPTQATTISPPQLIPHSQILSE
jgi:hypothetical protein